MTELPTQPLTLCIIRNNDKILLGMKKERFGKGKWNGFGGKVEKNETIEQAMVREMHEESGIDLLEYEKRGEMMFYFTDVIRHVHIYEGMTWNGEPTETQEMQPQWFSINQIPFESMWESDTAWFPYFLKRIVFAGTAAFDENFKLLSLEVKEV